MLIVVLFSHQAPWRSEDARYVGYDVVEDELDIKEGEIEQDTEDFLKRVS